jgi:hypothetical protein
VKVGGGVGVNVLVGIKVAVFVTDGVTVLGWNGVFVMLLVGVCVAVGVTVGVKVLVLVTISGVKLRLGVGVMGVAVRVPVGATVGVAVMRESGANESVMKPMQ